MDQKNRLAVAVVITILIVVAMFTSFGRSLFALNTPSVELPDTGTSSGTQANSSLELPLGSTVPVDLTADNVQAVIETLSRSDSYYRDISIENYWSSGSNVVDVQVWVDGGWSHTRQALPSGLLRHDLVGDGTLYYWYEGSSRFNSAPADDRSADLSQRIPTYETVLALDPDDIADVGYELRGEIPCIFVETAEDALGYVQRYWIQIESGLLISAESEQDGSLVYRMTAYSPVQSPCPASASFALPDGTELHTIS